MSPEPSRFIWYELMTTDIAAAAGFYGDVVGWSMTSPGTPGMDYPQWSIAGETIGGAMTIPPDAAEHGMRPIWLGYLNVADVDACVAQIVSAGGSSQGPGWDVPGVGRLAVVSDPQGASFYVMAPIGEGVGASFAPGRAGHGGWNELHTSDWRAALDFYARHFGRTKSDAVDMGPMGTYQLFGAGGGAIGGMINSPALSRPAWLYYFSVDDIHAAKARVDAAGGEVLIDPHEVPGGGWIVRALDPQGAMFALVGPNKTRGPVCPC